MTNSIRAPFPWFGGKGNLKIKNFILQNLPHHTRYIEPFGGGGSILISKKPAEVEVYNDVNRGVVNFFPSYRIARLFRAVHGAGPGYAVFARTLRRMPPNVACDS